MIDVAAVAELQPEPKGRARERSPLIAAKHRPSSSDPISSTSSPCALLVQPHAECGCGARAAAGGASSAARADALRGVSERVSKPLRLLRRLLRGARALSRTDPHTCSCSCACDLPSAVCRLECLTQVTRPSSRRRSSKTRTVLAGPSARTRPRSATARCACACTCTSHAYWHLARMSRRAGCSPAASAEAFGARIGPAEAHAPGAHSQHLTSPLHVQS